MDLTHITQKPITMVFQIEEKHHQSIYIFICVEIK